MAFYQAGVRICRVTFQKLHGIGIKMHNTCKCYKRIALWMSKQDFWLQGWPQGSTVTLSASWNMPWSWMKSRTWSPLSPTTRRMPYSSLAHSDVRSRPFPEGAKSGVSSCLHTSIISRELVLHPNSLQLQVHIHYISRVGVFCMSVHTYGLCVMCCVCTCMYVHNVCNCCACVYTSGVCACVCGWVGACVCVWVFACVQVHYMYVRTYGTMCVYMYRCVQQLCVYIHNVCVMCVCVKCDRFTAVLQQDVCVCAHACTCIMCSYEGCASVYIRWLGWCVCACPCIYVTGLGKPSVSDLKKKSRSQHGWIEWPLN